MQISIRNHIDLKAYWIIGFLSFWMTFSSLGSDKDYHDAAQDLYLKYQEYNKIIKNSNNPDTILFYANEILKIAGDDSLVWKARSYFYKGDGFKLKGEIFNAVESYLTGIKFYELLEHKRGTATGYSNLGAVYRIQENYLTSSFYYEKASKIFEEEKDTIRLATCLLNFGEVKRNLKAFDDAIFLYKRSISLFKIKNYSIGIAYSLGNIGLVYAAQNKYDSAEYYINQATDILEGLGDRYPIAVYQTYMADIYKDKGDWEKALEYAHNSLQIAQEEGLKEQVRDASLKLSELYRDKQKFEKAYHFQNQYIIYRDSINNEEVIRKMADLRTEYEVSKKQVEVDLLAQKNETQQIFVYAFAAIIFLLGILVLLVYQNSRKRKRVNQLLSDQKSEIAQQRDQLEELVNMKDRFFGIISHDLRSPVNSLQGILRLLEYYVKSRQIDQIEEFVSLADKSINNLSSLLDNLLSWALNQQGSLPYRPEKFQFYYVAKEVSRIFTNMAVAKNIELKVEVDKEIELYADRDSVFALIRNLINNAIKFTRERGVVMLTANPEGDYTRIIVCDTGVGIPEKNLKNLFEFDKKKSTKGTFGEKGSGLGLALCKDIVTLNHGTISVESKEREGTRFDIHIPAKEHPRSKKGSALIEEEVPKN